MIKILVLIQFKFSCSCSNEFNMPSFSQLQLGPDPQKNIHETAFFFFRLLIQLIKRNCTRRTGIAKATRYKSPYLHMTQIISTTNYNKLECWQLMCTCLMAYRNAVTGCAIFFAIFTPHKSVLGLDDRSEFFFTI